MNREPVIVSDLHGCFGEFSELLKTIQYNSRQIRLISVGDIMDRSPPENQIACLRKIQELGIECCQSNHETKHLRHHNFNLKEKLTGKKNPLRPLSVNDYQAHKQLTEEDFDWIRRLPASIHVEDDWYVVHAGLEPGRKFRDQSIEQMIRIRYVDKDGFAVPRKDPIKGDFYWADKWEGKQSIVFGHNVFESPQVFRNKRNTCVGIDTGCVYGGYLTALWLRSGEFTKIKAKKVHYERKR